MIPKYVKIYEVGPRDGLQNEKENIPIEDKVKFINYLTLCDYPFIEVGSFVSSKWIPQMKNSNLIFKKIKKNKNTNYPLLVPNMKGLHDAVESEVKNICIFTTSSETFSKKNTNRSVKETSENIKQILKEAYKKGIKVRGYISCVLGCPYEGEISFKKTTSLAKFLIEYGCYEVSLGDTVGYGTPLDTKSLIHEVSKKIPSSKIAMHMHDTYGQALANIFASLEMGISTFDTSAGGLGGCPYARGAAGNVATEDVLYMLNGMGIKTGINLKKVLKATSFIYKILNRDFSSKVASAMIKK